jgi:transitional endoplasmic reticulum ATPase
VDIISKEESIMSFVNELGKVYSSGRHHAFILHGSVNDLQVGTGGSMHLGAFLLEYFTLQGKVSAFYRIGVGWRFVSASDEAKLANLLGSSDNAGDGALAALAGLAPSQEEGKLPEDLSGAIDATHKLVSQSDVPVAIIIDGAGLVVPNQPANQMQPSDKVILSQLSSLAMTPSRNLAILVVGQIADLHESIRSVSGRWYSVQITNPDEKERTKICTKALSKLSIPSEMTAEELGRMTAGITRSGLMDIFYQARQDGELIRSQVKELKDRIISQENGDLVTFIDPLPGGFDSVGGLDEVKAYFQSEVIDPIRQGELGEVPNGILLAGAAGLGKTYVMRAVAEESKMTVVDFSVNRLLGAYVGQSESNLERAIQTIRACAPVVVVMDELEQSFPDRATAGPSGDSGVGSRIMKRMLEVLSDTSYRGRIVWVGITNYPQKLDAAFSRAGRFDDVIPFFPPTAEQVDTLLRVYGNKYGIDLSSDQAISVDLVGYTPAEIESVVRKARKLHRSNGDPLECLQQAVRRTVSNTRGVQSMTDSALRACSDMDLVPVEYQDRWRRLTSSEFVSGIQAQPEPVGLGDGLDGKDDRLF